MKNHWIYRPNFYGRLQIWRLWYSYFFCLLVILFLNLWGLLLIVLVDYNCFDFLKIFRNTLYIFLYEDLQLGGQTYSLFFWYHFQVQLNQLFGTWDNYFFGGEAPAQQRSTISVSILITDDIGYIELHPKAAVDFACC